MPIHITGVRQHLRAIGKAKKESADRIDSALAKAAAVILRKSLIYVPIETGALSHSGRIEIEGQGFGAKAAVVFGGTEAHYALYVHEDLTKIHEPPPRQAKFLERAARETRGTCASIVKRELVSGTYRDVDREVTKIENEE